MVQIWNSGNDPTHYIIIIGGFAYTTVIHNVMIQPRINIINSKNILVVYTGTPDVEAELQRDYMEFKINSLCTRDESGAIKVICFNKAAPLSSFAKHFYVLTMKFPSSLFHTMWVAGAKQARAKHPTLSISDFKSEVWSPVFQQCQKLLDRLQGLSITLGEVDTHFRNYETSKKIKTELGLLLSGLNECLGMQASDHWIGRSVQRIAKYRELCSYCDVAKSFLELKAFLQLSGGDFSDIERISNEVITFFYMSFCY